MSITSDFKPRFSIIAISFYISTIDAWGIGFMPLCLRKTHPAICNKSQPAFENLRSQASRHNISHPSHLLAKSPFILSPSHFMKSLAQWLEYKQRGPCLRLPCSTVLPQFSFLLVLTWQSVEGRWFLEDKARNPFLCRHCRYD
jgi:hypothetical protein